MTSYDATVTLRPKAGEWRGWQVEPGRRRRGPAQPSLLEVEDKHVYGLQFEEELSEACRQSPPSPPLLQSPKNLDAVSKQLKMPGVAKRAGQSGQGPFAFDG